MLTRNIIAFLLLAMGPLALFASASVLLSMALLGRDSIFTMQPLQLSEPVRLSAGPDVLIRTYELLSRGVGPNDPVLFTDPITTGGMEQEVGLVFMAAGEGDVDLLRLLIKKGADPSAPVNITAICAATLRGDHGKARILLEELQVTPNPVPRCLNDSLSPLAIAQKTREDRVRDVLITHGARQDY